MFPYVLGQAHLARFTFSQRVSTHRVVGDENMGSRSMASVKSRKPSPTPSLLSLSLPFIFYFLLLFPPLFISLVNLFSLSCASPNSPSPSPNSSRSAP